MPPSRPIIGINTTFEMDAEGGLTAVKPGYWQSIIDAGGLPFLLPQFESPEIIQEALALVQGFVLIGGDDVPAERFGGGETLPSVVKIEPAREKTDFALLEVLLETSKPTLALCLGFQELNIARGGTIYQDLLYDGPPNLIRHYAQGGPPPIHDVQVEPDSRLAEALGRSGAVSVNSTHHQALDRIGEGLRTSARASDGIVEAIELEGDAFFVGVQWHPEMMVGDPVQRGLFTALVQAAGAERGAGTDGDR